MEIMDLVVLGVVAMTGTWFHRYLVKLQTEGLRRCERHQTEWVSLHHFSESLSELS